MSVLRYSAITAKIHSMTGKLLDKDELNALCTAQTVEDFATRLRDNESYREGFELMGAMRLNRNKIEQVLLYSLYRDFKKIYNFATLSQKKYLHFYILQYEADIIKTLLMRFLLDSRLSDELLIFETFIKEFTHIDYDRLRNASTIGEFIDAFEKSPYYNTLLQVNSIEGCAIYDYETQIDLRYLSLIWHTAEKKLKKTELEIFKDNYGTQIDMMNINWIYRAKKYYNMTPIDIYKVIIPIGYRLHKTQLKELVESQSLDSFEMNLTKTYYTRHSAVTPSLEELYVNTIEHAKKKGEKRNPYSMASINLYLYNKTKEIRNLTIIIESIRYGLNAREKLS